MVQMVPQKPKHKQVDFPFTGGQNAFPRYNGLSPRLKAEENYLSVHVTRNTQNIALKVRLVK